MKLLKKEKKYLLNLSRKALTHIFKTGKSIEIDEKKIPEKLKQKMATFVTLTKDGQLRGCIGKLVALKPLFKDVIENTYSAAFSDPRFPQLTKKELDQVKIEISVLDKPKELKYKDTEDLVKKLGKDKPGVILSYGMYQATFLPQVWEELPTAKEFLSHLCQKAGLLKDFWQQEKVDYLVYKVIKFSK